MPRCPVCGCEVSEDSEFRASYRDRVYYFCCDHCKEEFERNPEEFVES